MRKWEYGTKYVVLTSDSQLMMKVGSEIISGNKVSEFINSLGQDGWELVAVVERIGNEPPRQSGTQTAAAIFGAMLVGQPTTSVSATQHKAVTLGYYYHFKREILPKTEA